jgi:hypothetical protein
MLLALDVCPHRSDEEDDSRSVGSMDPEELLSTDAESAVDIKVESDGIGGARGSSDEESVNDDSADEEEG